ncbi:hypothetical protein [Streptomyces sp. R41]|uniref:Uncharacterized protein n=1 Tax=Streptomyces sp. R41 TaxID=3238632 RepID=A0AB39RKF4_9ACTN
MRIGDPDGVLVVGAVDHAHVVVERFEHPPGLDELSLGQSRNSMARRSSIASSLASLSGPHLPPDGLDLLQGDGHLAQFDAAVRGLGRQERTLLGSAVRRKRP